MQNLASDGTLRQLVCVCVTRIFFLVILSLDLVRPQSLIYIACQLSSGQEKEELEIPSNVLYLSLDRLEYYVPQITHILVINSPLVCGA